MKLAITINNIDEANYQATSKPDMNLDDNGKTQYENKWSTHSERVARIDKQRGQAFSMVRCQCNQIPMDNMKHNPDWDNASTIYDLLKFMALIEKIILVQT